MSSIRSAAQCMHISLTGDTIKPSHSAAYKWIDAKRSLLLHAALQHISAWPCEALHESSYCLHATVTAMFLEPLKITVKTPLHSCAVPHIAGMGCLVLLTPVTRPPSMPMPCPTWCPVIAHRHYQHLEQLHLHNQVGLSQSKWPFEIVHVDTCMKQRKCNCAAHHAEVLCQNESMQL